MTIGIDFDNTIVCYDRLFHKVAREAALIPDDLPATKLAVRDYLRRTGREEQWTEMQGYVYGARMAESDAYPGVIEFLRWAAAAGLQPCIISHKTRHPFRGPPYDLHRAASDWVEKVLVIEGRPLIPPERVFFELTKDDKFARIGRCGCSLFIDDLPEILLAAAFPDAVERLLFDPEGHHGEPPVGLRVVPSWHAIRQLIETRCATTN